MAHQKLLVGMVALLIAGAGGVFVLVSADNSLPEAEVAVPKEALVAGISVEQKKIEESKEEQAAQVVQKKVLPQPKPKVMVQEIAPIPVLMIPLPPPPSTGEPVGEPKVVSEVVDILKEIPVVNGEDAEVVVVEEIIVSPSASAPQPKAEQFQGKIDINTANVGELQKLNGIGKVLSQRIVDYRNTSGFFQSIEDIKNVKGIADAKFENMKDQIMVGNVLLSLQPPQSSPTPLPSPAPSPSPLSQPEGHTFYVSSHRSSKYYYCDTASEWKDLSETYLESYPSEEALKLRYPNHTLHKSCK
jgi:competence ComEA-like helix-hairpin-helix protein